MARARVLLCVGCKAELDHREVYDRLTAALAARGWEVLPPWAGGEPEACALINGCPVGCLERPAAQLVVVARGHDVEGDRLPDAQAVAARLAALLAAGIGASPT